MKTGPGPLFFPLSVSLSLFSLNLVTHLFIPLSCPLSPSLCIRGTTRLQENTATHRFFFLFCRVQESGAGCFNTCGLCQGKENQSVKGALELSLLFGFFFFLFPSTANVGLLLKRTPPSADHFCLMCAPTRAQLDIRASHPRSLLLPPRRQRTRTRWKQSQRLKEEESTVMSRDR